MTQDAVTSIPRTFHQADLEDACERLKAGQHILVLGPPGIGKRAFLTNIARTWSVNPEREDASFWLADLEAGWFYLFDPASPYAPPGTKPLDVGRLIDRIERSLREIYASSHSERVIYLVDNLDALSGEPDASLRSRLAALIRQSRAHKGVAFAIASDAAPWVGTSNRPELHEKTLGLVTDDEAKDFIARAVPAVGNSQAEVRSIAGNYPFYLKEAAAMLRRQSRDGEKFSVEAFRGSFGNAMEPEFSARWQQLTKEEQVLLCQIAALNEDAQIPDKFSNSPSFHRLRQRALLESGGRIFSAAFRDYVREQCGLNALADVEGQAHAAAAGIGSRAWLIENPPLLIVGFLVILMPLAALFLGLLTGNPLWMLGILFVTLALILVGFIVLTLRVFRGHSSHT